MFHWDTKPDAYQFCIPKLVLQPMIENSISHGLASSGRTLDIFIAIHVSDSLLSICVRDNGNGVDPEKLEQLQKSLADFQGFHEKHIGLQNLFRRMKLKFPDEQCHIDLDSRPASGFCVTVSIKTEALASAQT